MQSPYLVLITTAVRSTAFRVHLDLSVSGGDDCLSVESESPVVHSANVYLGNELRLLVKGLPWSDEKDRRSMILLQEMLGSEAGLDNSLIRIQIDGCDVALFGNPAIQVKKSRLLGKDIRMFISLSLFPPLDGIWNPGCSSCAFLNGKRRMLGRPEPALVGVILDGLAEGNAQLVTRMETDPDICSRLMGEYRFLANGLERQYALCIMVSLENRAGDAMADGAKFSRTWLESAKACALHVSNKLFRSLQELELENRRLQYRHQIREVHAASISEVLEKFAQRARNERPDFERQLLIAIDNMAWHGETTVHTLQRRLNEIYQ